GPEEARAVAWARHIVSASNVLQSPDVLAGLVLVVAAYHLTPCAVWLARRGEWHRYTAAQVAVVLVAGLLAASAPKPPVADALLEPHPLIWLLFGNRPEHIWRDSEGIAAAPEELQGRVRFS